MDCGVILNLNLLAQVSFVQEVWVREGTGAAARTREAEEGVVTAAWCRQQVK